MIISQAIKAADSLKEMDTEQRDELEDLKQNRKKRAPESGCKQNILLLITYIIHLLIKWRRETDQ